MSVLSWYLESPLLPEYKPNNHPQLPYDVVQNILAFGFASETHHPVEDHLDIVDGYEFLLNTSLVSRVWCDASQEMLWKVVFLEDKGSAKRCILARKRAKEWWATKDLVIMGKGWGECMTDLVEVIGALRGIQRLCIDRMELQIPLQVLLCMPDLQNLDLGKTYMSAARLRQFSHLRLNHLHHLSFRLRLDTHLNPMDFRVIHHHLFRNLTSLDLEIYRPQVQPELGRAHLVNDYLPIFATIAPNLKRLHLEIGIAVWDIMTPFLSRLTSLEKLVVSMKRVKEGILSCIPAKLKELHVLEVIHADISHIISYIESWSPNSEELKLLVTYGETGFSRRRPRADFWDELALVKACSTRGIGVRMLKEWRMHSMM